VSTLVSQEGLIMPKDESIFAKDLQSSEQKTLIVDYKHSIE